MPRAQVTIRGIFLDANPFITSYAPTTNKYHTGYYSTFVRAPGQPLQGRECLLRMTCGAAFLKRRALHGKHDIAVVYPFAPSLMRVKHCLVGSKCCGAEVSLKLGAPGVAKLTLRQGGCMSNVLTSQACWPHSDAVVRRRAQSTQAYESAQIQFLQNALATSTATYNFVTAH